MELEDVGGFEEVEGDVDGLAELADVEGFLPRRLIFD